MADCIQKSAKEVLEVSKVGSGEREELVRGVRR